MTEEELRNIIADVLDDTFYAGYRDAPLDDGVDRIMSAVQAFNNGRSV